MNPFEDASTVITRFLANPDAPGKTKQRLKKSIDIVHKAFIDFEENELALSFNGGKDCLVMLYIILAAASTRLQTVYIRNSDSFQEVDDFVDNCATKYQLRMQISTKPMKEALETYLSDHKNIKAVFVGIRKGDPWSQNLKYIQPTDQGWPDFLRIHPMLDWEYDDIWNFLRISNIPYCSLYDLGYTSLGGTSSTIQNPSLQREDGSYAKAYELKNFSLERSGRIVAPR